MSKPNSFKVQPWTAFPRDAYSILTDDFIHEKLLTVKVTAVASRGIINLKNQILTKGDAFQSAGEIKAWFPVWKNGTIYFKSVNKEFKLHYDHGLAPFSSGLINWYGSYQMIKKNNSSTFKLGAIFFHPKYELDNRIRVSYQDVNEPHISTAHKVTFAKDKWSFTGFEIWNWTGPATIARNALRVCYRQNEKNSFFLRAANNSDRQFSKFQWNNPDSYFDYFALNAVHQINPQLILAGQFDFTRRNIKTVSGLVLKHFPQRKAWGKVRVQNTPNGINAALAYQGKLSDYGKWLLGTEIADLGKKNALKWGVQIDLNL